MMKQNRHQFIIETLKKSGFLSASEIAEQLNVSVMTVRRDLADLEALSLIQRVRGGAKLPHKEETVVPSFEERSGQMQEEKDAIGQEALAFIKPDSIICFDAGTTTLAVLNSLPQNIHFTAITTGVRTAIELSRFPNVNIVQVGGSLDHNTLTVSSSLAVRFLHNFKADVAFISTRTLDPKTGIYDHSLNLVEEKQAVADIADKVVILADHTKFNNTSLCRSLSINEIDVVITDDGASAEQISQLRKSGIEVIVAPVKNISME